MPQVRVRFLDDNLGIPVADSPLRQRWELSGLRRGFHSNLAPLTDLHDDFFCENQLTRAGEEPVITDPAVPHFTKSVKMGHPTL